jgi:hypothetical protein
MRWARIALVVAGCVSLGGVLGACTSGGESGAPRPSRLAPPVPGNPLDMTKAAAAPCTLLRPDQLAQYHLVAPGTASGATCSWPAATSGLPSYTAAVDRRSGGLEGLYHKRNTMPVFQPATVSEYPAVHTATTPAALHEGHCTVEVGVADDTLLVVGSTVPSESLDYTTPCDDADTFAADIIANSQAGQP